MLISSRVPREVRISVVGQAFGACVLAAVVGRLLMAGIISLTSVPQLWALLMTAIIVAALLALAGLSLAFTWLQTAGLMLGATGVFVTATMLQLTPDADVGSRIWWGCMFLICALGTVRVYSEGWKRP